MIGERATVRLDVGSVQCDRGAAVDQRAPPVLVEHVHVRPIGMDHLCPVTYRSQRPYNRSSETP